MSPMNGYSVTGNEWDSKILKCYNINNVQDIVGLSVIIASLFPSLRQTCGATVRESLEIGFIYCMHY